MFFLFLTLILIAPVLLILWIGIRLVRSTTEDRQNRQWILFLVSVAIIILITNILTSYSEIVQNRGFSYIALLLLPALKGTLVLLILQWHTIYVLWRKEKILFSILLAVPAILVTMTGLFEPLYLPVILVPPIILAGLWAAARRMGGSVLVISSLCVLVLEIVQAAGGFIALYRETGWLRSFVNLFDLLAAVLAVVLTALLISTGSDKQQGIATTRRVVYYTLAALLLLGLAADTLSYGVMVKATAHIAEDRMPIGQLAISIITGMVFIAIHQERQRLVGVAFTVLVPLLVILSYAAGSLFDPQAITVKRAELIRQTLEHFHEQTGAYPNALSDLTPRYLLYVPRPLTGRDQIWCYQGGGDTYRFGYIFIQGYYPPSMEPYVEMRMISHAGKDLDAPWMCDDELERGKSNLGL